MGALIILSNKIGDWVIAQLGAAYRLAYLPKRQKVGGVQALTTTQRSEPTLRKRCGVVLRNR